MQKDPTEEKKRTLKTPLKPLLENKKKQRKKTKDAYDHLIPTANVTPQIYGTPKIHKKDTPLRPIVDSIGSVTYNLSKALVEILRPLLGTTEHHCKNSKELAQELNNIAVEKDEIFISHNVISLFTKTPLTSLYTSYKNALRKTGPSKNAQTSQLMNFHSLELRCQIHLFSVASHAIKHTSGKQDDHS